MDRPGMLRDDRPRIYIRETMDGRVHWRMRDGSEGPARSVSEAVEITLGVIKHKPAVIFWEGRTDG